MNVIVSGAGGFIGTNLVIYLLAQGYNVLGFDVKRSISPEVNRHLILSDFLNLEKVFEICDKQNPDFLIHLAAETGMESGSPEDYSFNYESIEAIGSIADRYSSIKKVILTSSLLVCKNGYVPVNDYDLCPPNGYGHSKARSEAVAREVLKNVSWDIVRPTSIWGEYFSGGYELFFKVIRQKLFLNPNIAEIIKPTCYVGNAVFMLHKLMLDEGSSRVFYLADYPSRSVQEWAKAISMSFHGRNILRSVGPTPLKAIAFLGDLLTKIGISFPLTSFRLKNMLVSQEYPTENLRNIAGPLPFSLQESCDRTVSWIKEQDG
jgi:GlcNAc-P-P-Und epimerase